MKINILGKNLYGYLDCGASHVMVNGEGYQKLLNLGFQLKLASFTNCELADSGRIECAGYISVPIRVKDKVCLFDVLVLPTLKYELVLGRDFWRKLGLIPNIRDLTFTMTDEAGHSEVTSTPKLNSIQALSDLSPPQHKQLKDVLNKYFDAVKNIELGCTNLVKHKIELVDGAKPFKAKNYRFSPYALQKIDKEWKEMLRLGVIRHSSSEFNSPAFLIPKKDGTCRFVVNYQKLNSISKCPAYPLPNMTDILDKLGNARYLSSLDVRSVYWQIPLEESSRKYTAFSIPGRGSFEFCRVPYGLHGAPGTFQSLVDGLINVELEPYAFSYLDDIIIATPTFELHLEILQKVLDRILEAGLVLKPEKCEFCKPELKYLGHVVNRHGLNIDLDKVKAIVDMPRPKNVRGVRRIVGTMSWFRKFVKNFASLVEPLVRLTKKNAKFKWTPECEQAFQAIKNTLVSAPILSCPDFSKSFKLHTDASFHGLGGVLTQEIDGEERVICYVSRALSAAEQKYSATEKECLAVIFAIEKLRCYLEFTKFTVVTDCYALKWLHSLKDPLGRLGRWVLRLQNFNFDVVHRPGKDNIVPDCLSRAIPEVNVLEVDPIDQIEPGRDRWYDTLKRQIENDPLRFPNFRLQNNKIYKKVSDPAGQEAEWRIVVPSYLRTSLLRKYHDNPRTGAHLGIYKTYNKIKNQYTWPKMKSDIARYIQRCRVCSAVKPQQQHPPGLMGGRPPIQHCWQMISVDLFGPLPRSKNGNEYILAILDYFSKFPIFVPLKQATAQKVISEIEEKVFLIFGVPEYLIADNGVQFGRSGDFNRFLNSYGVKPYYNSLYTPQNNPTERLNRTMKTLIISYIQDDQRTWDEHLSQMACALRTAKHETTRKSPYYVNFAREMVSDGREYARLREREYLTDSSTSSEDDVDPEDARQNKLARIRLEVQHKLRQAHNRIKRFYDRKRRDLSFEIGDIVWRREYATTDSTKHFTAKLAKRYSGPFTISERIGSNVYVLTDPAGRNCGRWHVKDLKIYHPTTSDSSDEDDDDPHANSTDSESSSD